MAACEATLSAQTAGGCFSENLWTVWILPPCSSGPHLKTQDVRGCSGFYPTGWEGGM